MPLLHGLICETTAKAVPLQHISVKLKLCDTIACVSSKLVYKNECDLAVEAVFSFPVDDSAAVFQCDAEIDGRHITGECQEMEMARNTYDTAVDSGHGAFLMEEHVNAGDIFRMSLGNLPAGKSATITFSYVLELDIDSAGVVEFKLPTLLTPRYNLSHPSGRDGSNSPTYCHPTEVPYTLDFNGIIESQMTVEDVISLSAEGIKWKREETGKIAISLKNAYDFKSEVGIRVVYSEFHKPSLIVAKGNPELEGILKHDIAMLSFCPKFQSEAFSGNVEIILIIDRSWSMEGERITQAKATLLLFLKSLPVGCYFNIISFGSHFELLFPTSKVYNKQSLEEAIELQKSLEADMIGTDILEPLTCMYDKMPTISGYLRKVFLLTDGNVSNGDAILQQVRKHASHTKMFSFGIGDGVSTSFIKGIARAGKGKAVFVSNTDRLQSQVISALSLATQHSVENLGIEWKTENNNIRTIPDELPSLFHKEHLVVYGIPGRNFREGEGIVVTLSGQLHKETIAEQLEYVHGDLMENDFLIHRLAAKRQIKVLQDCGTDTEDSIKKKIITLSLAANIVSKYTAFVGIDRSIKETICQGIDISTPLAYAQNIVPSSGTLSPFSFSVCRNKNIRSANLNIEVSEQSPSISEKCKSLRDDSFGVDTKCKETEHSSTQAKISISEAQHRESLSSRIKQRVLDTLSSVAGFIRSPTRAEDCKLSDVDNAIGSDDDLSCSQSFPADSDLCREAPEEEMVTSLEQCEDKCITTTASTTRVGTDGEKDAFKAIIASQEYDGCWKSNQDLSSILGVELEYLKKHCPEENQTVWFTALVLAWLEIHCADQNDEWILIAAKARQWMRNQQAGPKKRTEKDLIEMAIKYLTALPLSSG